MDCQISDRINVWSQSNNSFRGLTRYAIDHCSDRKIVITAAKERQLFVCIKYFQSGSVAARNTAIRHKIKLRKRKRKEKYVSWLITVTDRTCKKPNTVQGNNTFELFSPLITDKNKYNPFPPPPPPFSFSGINDKRMPLEEGRSGLDFHLKWP